LFPTWHAFLPLYLLHVLFLFPFNTVFSLTEKTLFVLEDMDQILLLNIPIFPMVPRCFLL
jgi:hypothetical protein